MSEHSYFVFDPEIPDAAYKHDDYALVLEWLNTNPITNGSNTPASPLSALTQWANHSLIDDTAPPTAIDGLTAAYTKSHTSSMVMRTAEQYVYTATPPTTEDYIKDKVGYFVELPERLSTRQIEWVDLIAPPMVDGTVLLTEEEYLLLKHLKVISSIHTKKPIYLYRIPYRPLAERIKSNMSDYDIYISCLKPKSSQALMTNFSWWIKSLTMPSFNNEKKESFYLYKVYAKAHLNLIIRNERINQLKALVYAHYYTDPTVFLGDTHKIKPNWITKQSISDNTELNYRIFCQDGWFKSVYSGNKLTLALVTLASVGYWSVECDGDDPSDLLTTTAEGFVMAHQSESVAAKRLQDLIYKPQNPFDMKQSLFRHNGLMPVLASACCHSFSSVGDLAAYFDSENPKEFTEILLSSDNNEDRDALMIQLINKLRRID